MIKKIILLILTLSIYLHAMDAPQESATQEIPVELQLKYNQERDRFRSYYLDNPETKFLPKLRTELKKDENITQYLESLNLFANLLFAQHLLLNQAIQLAHINKYQIELIDHEKKLMNQLGITQKKGDKRYFLSPPTIDILNELITHQSILASENPLTPEQLKIVFMWSFSDNIWLQILAEQIVNSHLLKLTAEQKRSVTYNISEKIIAIDNAFNKLKREFNTLPRLLKNNIVAVTDIYEAHEKANKRLTSAEERKVQYATSFISLADDYANVIIRHGLLYNYTHNWYEQLYKVIRTEISATIKDLITKKTNVAGIGKYAANMYPDLYPEKVLPQTFFPLSASPQLFTNASIEPEKIQIRKEWDEEQKQKEIVRQKATKIKESPDGSFILEFENTPTSITIHNPKNNTQEIIFKHEYPQEINKLGKNVFPINYTNWVKEWFTDPHHAIENQGYTDRTSKKFTVEQDRWKPIALHAFSPIVDEYIKQWGRVSTIKNRKNPSQEDILITIPGKMIYPAGSNPPEEAGVFAYIIDSKSGQWYHRMFTSGKLSELTKNLFEKGYFAPEMTGYYDIFFPALPSRKK